MRGAAEDFRALAARAAALASPVPDRVVAELAAALRPHRDKFLPLAAPTELRPAKPIELGEAA
jgi:hypothetical protein